MSAQVERLGGRYALGERLGAGAMGVVWASEDADGAPVAIKLLLPALGREPQFAERFRREAEVARRIRHPNIVQVLDFGADADLGLFYVMERLEGCDLKAYLEAHPGLLSSAAAIALLEAVLGALWAAHDASIVHRDIKPGNLFLVGGTVEGGVKVVDFGLAKDIEAQTVLTRTGAMLGTPAYMAPEQVRGHPVDARTDLYAVGCLACELLTGRLPFSAQKVYDVLALHLDRAPPTPSSLRPGLPRAVDALVLRALAKAPAARFGSAREMLDAVYAAGRALGVSDARFATLGDAVPEVSGPPAATLRLGRWQLERLLGEGAMGRVFAATDGAGARAAVKRLRPELVDSAQQVARVRREAAALAKLRHANVVAVLDEGEDEAGVPWVAMERLEGQPLDAWLAARGGACAPELAIELLSGMLAGLEAAHLAGLVHRDLKPANAFVVDRAGRPEVKLVDFGLAKDVGEGAATVLTKTGEILGTPAYMAPEQVKGEPVDARTDLYALGCMAFQLVTGALPFNGAPFAVMMAQAREPAPRPAAPDGRALPEALVAAIGRALEKSPAARFQSAVEMRAALSEDPSGRVHRRIRESLQTAAVQSSALEGAMGGGRGRLPWVVAAVGLLAAAATAAVLLGR